MNGTETRRAGRKTWLHAALAVVALSAAPASAAIVDVDVVSDTRGTVPLYGAGSRGRADTYRSYLEARDGERYGIRIRNNTGGRIAVVVAVDGRNIISGAKSYLRSEERMYVLPPYEAATYEGWRTARDTVNRFYFTDPGDAYAAAFGDRSAMGVIAVAVYREAEAPPAMLRDKAAPGARLGKDGGAGAAAPRSPAPETRSESAGTGFGEEADSPSVKVVFLPETRAAERHFLKYEWRDTLCRKGIIDCRWSRNRFWDDDEGGYAPPPPGR